MNRHGFEENEEGEEGGGADSLFNNLPPNKI